MPPTDLITSHFRLLPAQRAGLEKLGLLSLKDLLLHFPARYARQGEVKNIADLAVGELATISGRLTKTKISRAWRKKIPMSEAIIEDATGKIKAIWFHQAYMVKKFPEGSLVTISGKVTERKGQPYLANPDIRGSSGEFGDTNSLFSGGDDAGELIAIYPESRGVSSNWLHHTIAKLLTQKIHLALTDSLPVAMSKKYNLPPLSTALVWIHRPAKESDAIAARKRFSFEEIFFIQLARLRDKNSYQQNGGLVITDGVAAKQLTDRLPFQLTKAQDQAIATILADFAKGVPMTRLLEGDVGSGKTAVAAATAASVVAAGYEVAYMAPTEILAKQHFASFIDYFSPRQGGARRPISIGLLTGSDCRKFPSKLDPSGSTTISRPQLLKWVANGEIPILIGTHALIQKTVAFKNLAYVIIDEQHRFGVTQRAMLVARGPTLTEKFRPHLLSMTATPIPRTLALTIYGDLDITLLDELPPGRKQIKTEIIEPAKRDNVYDQIRAEIKRGRQVYVICPRIDEPDPTKELALQAKSAKAEQKRLGDQVFPDLMVGLLHSKLKPNEKEEVMREFAAGNIHILVATSVVEVGVNVPNATVIIIEGAERFGLAQLHQLRGRVQRSSEQAYCYLFTETKSTKSLERLQALSKAKNGFELAELDLQLRGAGSLVGGRQWGLSDIGMEAVQNLKMVEAARAETKTVLAQDPALQGYPLLAGRLAEQKQNIHFE